MNRWFLALGAVLFIAAIIYRQGIALPNAYKECWVKGGSVVQHYLGEMVCEQPEGGK